MRHNVDADATVDLPEMFCWTKYGTEAGEDISTILARKEAERQANRGVFLWGIGNAVGPSIKSLLQHTEHPKVVFTPMLSKAAARDVAPPAVAAWYSGVGLDGSHYDVPIHSLVTSRVSSAGRPHYALVCGAEFALDGAEPTGVSFASNHVQNLRSGSKVGASQVTSVVRRVACALGRPASDYKVSFMANLVAPYLVRLTEYSLVKDGTPTGGTPPASHRRGAWAREDCPVFV